MEENLVVQANELLLATYMMTTKEKGLLLACISQIDSRPNAPSICKQTEFTVTVQEMKNLYYQNRSQDNAFRDMEQASHRLFNREVTLELENGKTLLTRFVSSVEFDPNSSQVTLAFAEKVLPYLTQLKKNFTKYRLLEITELSSIHSIRLYELMVMWVSQYQYSKKIDLDEFRYVMGIKGKYRQFGQLRERVIENAISEINANTDYTVGVEYHKTSRQFTSLTLKFHKRVLNKLINKDGVLSQEKIKAIVDNPAFMLDYNQHTSLTYNGKMDADAFKREMFNIILREPETFNKPGKSLDTYLPKIKQGA